MEPADLTKLWKQNSELRNPGQLEIVGQNMAEEGTTESSGDILRGLLESLTEQ